MSELKVICDICKKQADKYHFSKEKNNLLTVSDDSENLVKIYDFEKETLNKSFTIHEKLPFSYFDDYTLKVHQNVAFKDIQNIDIIKHIHHFNFIRHYIVIKHLNDYMLWASLMHGGHYILGVLREAD